MPPGFLATLLLWLDTMPAASDDALDYAVSLDALAERSIDAAIDTPDRYGPCEDSVEFKAQWMERWSPLFPGK